MASCAWICAGTLGRDWNGSIAAAALSAYAAGFVVVFRWTRRRHRCLGTRESRRALPAAPIGGAFGGLSALVLATAYHSY